MPIATTDDQRALARALNEWAVSQETAELCKASEQAGPQAWAAAEAGVAEFGVAGIVVPESHGGAGGTLVDLSVAVEACARAMVPGAVLPTALAAAVLAQDPDSPVAKALLPGLADGSVTVAFAPTSPGCTLHRVEGLVTGRSCAVLGAGLTSHVLLPVRAGEWVVIATDVAGLNVEAGPLVDLATRCGTVVAEDVAVGEDETLRVADHRVLDLFATLVAAECAGIAAWCLETAVEYAGVREQFGRKIGSFQALKHLCAEMLEDSETTTAVAWDAAEAHLQDADQHAIAAAVAGVVAPDLAVRTAQNCIQVLGGIGFTWEHHAHLYLRRATALRLMLGGTDVWRLRLADLALEGIRRAPRIDLGAEGERIRDEVGPLLRQVAALPETQQRTALVDAGLAMPHWPAPHGRAASAAEQIVIDEEYAAAGLSRPSLGIGAWAAPTILQHGNDAQRERFLGPTMRGEIVWCQLFSEPGAGSDLASLRTRAERTEGGWLLTGQKVWTSVAADADWGICLARTNPEAPQHKGITYFLVDMTSAGLDIRPLRELTGEALFNEVFLEQVFVPDDCVVGEVDGGWPLARTTLANERVALSDSSFGVSVERALRLVASGGAGEAQRVRVGDAVAAAGAVKALGTRATLRSLAGEGPGAESSVLKLVGVRQRQDSAELAVGLLGGEVLTGSAEAEAALQEALVTRCLSIAGGTTQVLRNVAAERILGLPRG